MQPPEIVEVDAGDELSCDGGKTYGHPRVYLTLGEDGHVASLFPGSVALEEERRLVVAVPDSPKPPPVRLTMTLLLMACSPGPLLVLS